MRLNFILIAIAIMVISGCALDPSLQLAKGTKLQLIDVTKVSFVSRNIANNDRAVEEIRKRILEVTRDELQKYRIEAFTKNTPGAAKLKLDIRRLDARYGVVGTGFSMVRRNNYEIKYKITLESPEGKVLLVYTDEQDDSDFDDTIERVGSKISGKVADYYKQ